MRTLSRILVVISVVAVGLALLVGGIALGRSVWGIPGVSPDSMMAGYVPSAFAQADTLPDGYGTMSYNYGQVYTGTLPYGYGMPLAPCAGGGMGSFGMMDMMGSLGPGMMGQSMMMHGFGSNALFGIEPLSLDEAQIVVEDYLTALEDDKLALGEMMIFDNHAYAQVVEKSTGIGAFEVLVDPVTLGVTPKPGPNMMWNAKYSPMSGFGGFGMMGMMNMMGGFGFQGQGDMMGSGMMMGGTTVPDIPAEMPVSPDEAIETAQRYLDVYLPGAQAEEEADAFYGYYTIHILRDGQTVGMLSVNGYTRQVFLHTWHGDLLEMTEVTQG
jgi:hypothetical protein